MSENSELSRCPWCLGSDIYISYHDKEWGVPLHDDRKLFELIVLEGAQAGLSWLTILKRREGYRKAFGDFDIKKVAGLDEAKIEKLLQDTGIIRNRLKVVSAVNNAKAFIKIQKEFGSFDSYIWGFVGGKPINHRFSSLKELPAHDDIADNMSKELKKRGFSFVGPSICYAFMQSIGMVNDHLKSCFRYSMSK